jgi:hypothetical protein
VRPSRVKTLLVGCAVLAGCALPRLGESGARLDAAPPQTLRLSDEGDDDDGDDDEQAAAPAAGRRGVAAAGDKPPQPLSVPLFDGSRARTHQPPAGKLHRPAIPDYRRLYDMVLGCWPADSWFRGDLYVEGRVATRTDSSSVAALDATTGTVTQRGDRYIALVARIPLVSATELDKERNREAERHGRVADAVGELVGAFAERVMTARQLALSRALEKRAQERVRAGVADTAEQVHYLEQVAALELKIQTLRAAEIKARLRMVGMCEARKMRPIDDYLEHFNQLR